MIPQPIDTVPLFQRLSEEERQLVTARLKRRQAAPDELIVSEGQPSDSLYVITAGWVKLESGKVDNAVTLANLGAGSLLGEADALMNRPYSMTARAAGTTPTQLLTLSRTDLEELIHEHPSIGLKFSANLGLKITFLEQYLIQHRLRNIELLSSLHEEDLRAIAQQLDFRSVPRGELIIEAGKPGDAVYIIEEGQVRLIAKTSEGEAFEDLDEGSIFGHTALVTGKPYTATVRAVTDASMWVLPRTIYQSLIPQRPAIKLAFSRALAESLSITDQADAVDHLRQLQLFADVPTESLHALASSLVLRHYPMEEAIYTEGTPGDAMYIVESGEVKLMDSAFSDAHLLERARAGDAFGEMALLTGRTRAECARAASDTTLWVLYKSDFDDIMVQYPEISVSLSRALTERLSSRESDFVVRHLRRINLFSNLATSELKTISAKVRGLRFRPGEIICYAGQPVHTLFMIEDGEVKRMGVGPAGEPVMIDILDSGDSFGEQEVVQNIPYNTTAQALGEVELWTISKNDFQQMLEAFPTLTLMITRMMADRLTRAQQYPPQARVQPYPPQSPGSPRPPTSRPGSPPPPTGRIQQPPSGARPINKPPHYTASAPHVQNPHAAPSATHTQAAHIPSAPHAQTIHHAASTAHTQTLLHTPSAPYAPPSHKPAHAATGAFQHNVPRVQPQNATQVPPHARRMQAPRARSQGGFFSEFGAWASGLTIGAKLRVLTLMMLFAWFALIAFPFSTASLVSSNVGGLFLVNAAPSDSGNAANKGAAPASGRNSSGVSKVAFAVATSTPIPTRTPAPTFTPLPQPTLKRILPTSTPKPVATTPPVATAALVPPLPPIEWDKRLGPQGIDQIAYPDLTQVRIIPANVAHGQKFWRAVKVKFEGLGESGNDHSLYVKVVGEDGKRIDGKKGKFQLEQTKTTEYPEEKKSDDVCDCNYVYAMFGDGYDVSIDDQYPSDTVAGMCMCGIKDVFSHKAHTNFRVTFQLVTNP